MNSSPSPTSSVLPDKLRSEIRSSDSRIRLEVLKGAFDTDSATALQWKSPSWKLLVFVSSPFTDTQQERSFLVDEYQFELRRIGQKYGIQVIFVDMRWGIQDQNTINHKTWEECAKVIEWCKLESMGVAFLSLQGNKYGYTPLPRIVMERDMQSHLSACGCSEEVRELIFDWYHIDDNSLPERRCFVLRNLAGVDDSDYWNAFEKILPVLSGLPFDTANYGDLLCVGKSVTEWEVRAALHSYPCRLDRSEGIFWSYRNLSGVIDDKSFCDFKGGNNEAATECNWNSLISYMKDEIPNENINDYSLSFSDFKSKDSTRYLDYSEHYRDFIVSTFSKSLDGIIQSYSQWNDDGMGMGLRGVELSEILHHCDFAKRKCSNFIGREGLIQSVIDEMLKENRQLNDKECKECSFFSPKRRFLGICLSVIGVSGAGKTALMAKAASEYFKIKPEKSIVIIRFCGTSPGSTNAHRLMISICAQIEYLCKKDTVKESDDLGHHHQNYNKVVAYFQSLLHDYPVILFIDSLDQLSDENDGRSQISFLKGVKPHPQTRIVVSCLPDEREVNIETGLSYLYLCETRLQEASVPRVLVEMTASSAAVEESMKVIDSLLIRRGRTLQQNQRQIVKKKFAEGPNTALYITLAVAVISNWTRDTDAETALPGSVVDLVKHLFMTLELEFGEILTRFALAVLTFSRKGISDIEMEDVLSMNDDVLNSVFTYHTPTVRRLPTHVWLRLKGAMEGLIVEGENGCYVWYHRQLRETAAKVYSSEKLIVHSLMAHYFGNIRDRGNSRKISCQPWVFHELPFHIDSVPNLRRCCESSYHMILGELFEEAESELCNFEGICSKIRCGEGFQLVREFSKMIEVFKLSNRKPSEKLLHYYRWVRRDIHFLSKNTLARFVASASREPKNSAVTNEVSSLCNIRQVKTFGSIDTFNAILAKLEGHDSFVTSVAFSPDGKTLASASGDHTIRVWDVATGEEKVKFEGHITHVLFVVFSPDGKTLASGSGDRTVRVWDVTTRKETAKLEGYGKCVWSVAFSPDGKTLASGSEDGNIRVLNVMTGKEEFLFEGDGKCVYSVAFSPNGKTLASGSEDGNIRVWDVVTRKVDIKLEGHSDSVKSVAFSPDGRMLASGSKDGTIGVWYVVRRMFVAKGKKKAMLLGHGSYVSSVAFSPDGKTLVSGSSDRTIRVWDIATGKQKAKLEGHSSFVTSVAYSPDGNTLASGSNDRTIHIWDIEGMKEKVQLELCCSPVISVAFSPDGKTLASGSFDETIRVWDVATGEGKAELKGHCKGVAAVAYNPDSNTLASGSFDRTVRVWNVATGKQKAIMEGHSDSVTSVAFSPDGISVASGSKDRTIRVWDVATGEERAQLEVPGEEGINAVAYSPDGKTLASGFERHGIRMWDVETEKQKDSFKNNFLVSSVAFSLDGKTLASGCGHAVKVWDVETGGKKATLEGHRHFVTSVAFSSDGKTVASGSHDGTIRMWDVETGGEKAILEGHNASVISVAFSPDGLTVASGSHDGTIRMWDVATGEGQSEAA